MSDELMEGGTEAVDGGENERERLQDTCGIVESTEVNCIICRAGGGRG